MINIRTKPYLTLVLVVIIGISLLTINVTLAENLSYEYSFIDEFDNLDNWSNASQAPLGVVDGIMTTSNGYLHADSYGIENQVWHGPAIYVNVSLTDFRFELTPKCQASYQELGALSIGFYSGDAASGTLLWHFGWYDAWIDFNVASLWLNDQNDYALWSVSQSSAAGSWDDPSDNMTLTRSDSTLKLYIDGALIYTNITQSTSQINSIVIQFSQWWYRSICDDLRLDSIKISCMETSIQSEITSPLITPLPFFTIIGTLVLLYGNRKRIKRATLN